MSEFGTHNRLIFHGAGYDALIPATDLPIPGGLTITRQADIRLDPTQSGNAVVMPRPEASIPETSLYAATAATLREQPVLVSTRLGMFAVDPYEQVPELDRGEAFMLVNRMSRVATGMLEQHLHRDIVGIDMLHVGGVALQFIRRYKNAQNWEAKRFRESLRTNEQFPQ
jgi:hypothetical protein